MLTFTWSFAFSHCPRPPICVCCLPHWHPLLWVSSLGKKDRHYSHFSWSCSEKKPAALTQSIKLYSPALSKTYTLQCDICFLLALFSVLFQHPSNYYCILILIRQEAALWVLTSCQYNQVWAMGMRSKCCFQNLVKNILLLSHSKYI